MQKLSQLPKKITCPRCGLKIYEGAYKCPDCGLIFSRLELATNKDAKTLIRKKEKDFVLKSSQLPEDVSFIKLLMLAIFLGPFGAHCFYVGRYWRASFLLIDMIAIFFLVLFNSYLIQVDEGALIGSLSTICGFIMLMWPWDILMIIFKKFKVPIAIDITANQALNCEDDNLGKTKTEDDNVKNNIEENNINRNDIKEIDNQTKVKNDNQDETKNQTLLDSQNSKLDKQYNDEVLFDPISWKESNKEKK